MHKVYTCMLHFVSLPLQITQLPWRTAQLKAIQEAEDIEYDDGVSLYRLFGFGLFASMRFRKRKSYKGT